MNHTVTFNPEEGFFRVKTSGQASMDGFADFLRDLFGHQQWEPGTDLLIDHRDLASSTFTADNVTLLAEQAADLDSLMGAGHCAVVVTHLAGYGLARMWQQKLEDQIKQEIRIYRSLPEAEAWLRQVRDNPQNNG